MRSQLIAPPACATRLTIRWLGETGYEQSLNGPCSRGGCKGYPGVALKYLNGPGPFRELHGQEPFK